MTLKEGTMWGGGGAGAAPLLCQQVAPSFWISSREILLVPCMLDCLKRGCQRFTPGAIAPSCWVTSFMTAALEEKSGSKQCSRHFLFFALYCQRADKSIRAVFPFRVLIVAISSSVQEFRRSRAWLRLIGFGVSMQSFRQIFPFCFPINK